MKTLSLFLFLFSFSLFAAGPIELTYTVDKTTSQKIVIKTMKGMKVSESCLKDEKVCHAFFTAIPANRKKEGSLRGNPASLFCLDKGGDPVILKDQKNNEYDYCSFPENHFVDSWDLYERTKK